MPEPRFVDGYLLYLLARASSQASGQFHALLAKRGVPVTDWRIMAVLAGTDGVTIGELAARCLFKQPTLTRAVDRLQAKKLVRRAAAGGDRRQVLVLLTASGQRLIDGLIEAAREHEAELLSTYSPTDIDALKDALATLIDRTSQSR